jgi:hypothetical protein
MRDQVGELGAPAVDAEGVRERERDLAAVAVGELRRLQAGRLGARPVPQIALEVDDPGRGDLGFVDVVGTELDAGAEIGRHGSLGVPGDENQAAGGRRPVLERRGLETDAGGADVMPEDLAQLIVLDLADVSGPGAERGERRHGVGAGAPRHLDRRSHALVELDHSRLVDQSHGAFGEIQALQRAVVRLGDDVDDRIAETEHMVGGGKRERHRRNSVAAGSGAAV